jgi:hypothetical protein
VLVWLAGQGQGVRTPMGTCFDRMDSSDATAIAPAASTDSKKRTQYATASWVAGVVSASRTLLASGVTVHVLYESRPIRAAVSAPMTPRITRQTIL